MAGIVLVTGPTGTVGAPLVDELVAAGEPVRTASAHPDRVRPGVEAVRADFTDPGGWPAAFDGVDRLFLMRPPAISDVRRYLRPVVRLAAERGLRQVVFLSLLGANPAMPHWRVERDLAAAGVPHTVLRPAYFAQNLLTALGPDIRERDRIRLPAGLGRTAFVDTRDVAAVAAAALRDPAAHTGDRYDLTGREALDWPAVASLLSATLGRPVRYEPVGLLAHRRELLAAGLDPTYVRVQLVIDTVARLGLADRVSGTLARLLGRPARTMAEFVADHADSWRR